MNKYDIPPANATCSNKLTHQHVQSNHLIQFSLSTALLFVSRISGPKSQLCGLHSQFALSNITKNTTKFYYIISQLDNTHMVELEDVITNPQPQAAMTLLKQN